MINVGDEFRHRFQYSQDDVDKFAEVSGDTNPLHLDEEYAKNSIFGRRIIHGFLGGAVFTKIFGTLLYAKGNIYMKQNMSFRKPMYTEKDYEAIITVKEIFKDKNRILFDTKVIDPETGDVTTEGEALILNKEQFVWTD